MSDSAGAGPRQAPDDRPTDEQLVLRGLRERRESAATGSGAQRSTSLDRLYGRYYERVARWALRFTAGEEDAAELAQEVFLQVHRQLHTFRAESRFSTWLYTITRRLAINRSVAAARDPDFEDEAILLSMAAPAPGTDESAHRRRQLRRIAELMDRELEPAEARAMVLKYRYGFTVPAITRELELENASGAKALLVGARRKLQRALGRQQTAARRPPTRGRIP